MDLREQVARFRELLEKSGLGVDDFELNVDSDAFKGLLAGGAGSLEVHFRPTGRSISYSYDGTSSWLNQLAADLAANKFRTPGP